VPTLHNLIKSNIVLLSCFFFNTFFNQYHYHHHHDNDKSNNEVSDPLLTYLSIVHLPVSSDIFLYASVVYLSGLYISKFCEVWIFLFILFGVLDVVTRLWIEQPKKCASIPNRGKGFFSFPKRPYRLLCLTLTPI
jgi:hypothetical protein